MRTTCSKLTRSTMYLYRFSGSAGQSFACFLTPGMNIRLVGEANDYVGKVCLKINVSFPQNFGLMVSKYTVLPQGNGRR